MDFKELLQRLRLEDEVTLLELLEVDSDMLVDAFHEHVLDNLSRIARHYEE